MPCLFSYNGITKQDGRAATLPLFSVSPTFRSHSLPIFFLICFRRTAYRQDAPFFYFLFRSDFCQREIPSQNPTDIRKKMPSLVYICARGRNICFTKRKSTPCFLPIHPLFRLYAKERSALFLPPRGAVAPTFFKTDRAVKKTVRRLQTGRRRSTTYPQTARLTI